MAITPESRTGTHTGRIDIISRMYLTTLIFLIPMALMTGQVQAAQTDISGSDQYTIEEIAGLLKTTVQSKTVSNIENYILHNFDYEFHWHPQTIDRTWETKTGDCTDRSLIIVEMLEKNGFEDARTVHGYVYDENGNKVKHDWVEVTVRVDGTGTFDTYEKVGAGVW